MSEWDHNNPVDYTGLILSYVFAVVAPMIVTACLQGCAKPVWPDIGGGVRVEKIRIMKCSERVDNCGRRV